MYIEFYFFNWTNANDLKSSKSKPVLQELGPYVFRYITFSLLKTLGAVCRKFLLYRL